MEANLTIYEALLGELESYSPSSLTLKKALIDLGVNNIDTDYVPESHQILVIKAAIKILNQLIVLTSDSQGKSSQSYDTKRLENRLKALCAKIGEDASIYLDVPTIEDGSHLW